MVPRDGRRLNFDEEQREGKNGGGSTRRGLCGSVASKEEEQTRWLHVRATAGLGVDEGGELASWLPYWQWRASASTEEGG